MALMQQASLLKSVTIEIILLDDGSQDNFKKVNQKVISLANVTYVELTQNVGRSAIRNRLADMATGDYLLFMDCDSEVVSNDYLKKYTKYLDPQKLLYGGRCYTPTPPKDLNIYFHWYYGKQREETSAEKRKKQPYHSFMTNNFLIPKGIFHQIGGFDERLRQYGHEDTVFGLELQRRGVKIHHFDNPLAHIGLEQTSVFLQKTKKGIENLHFLQIHYPELETRLLKAYQQVLDWRLTSIVLSIFKVCQPIMDKNFYSKHPSLFLFDMYKLGLLIQKGGNKKNRPLP